jgi:hypothetical protein
MVDITGKYRTDPHMRAVSIGIDTEHFITHDKTGQYLVEKAHECRINALEELVNVDPTNATGVLELQWKARIPDLFMQWLDQAIAEGRAAEEIILQEESLGQ